MVVMSLVNSVGDDHYVRGLQGEGGGTLPDHGGTWAVVVIGLSVLWVVNMFWFYLGRVMVMCQALDLQIAGACLEVLERVWDRLGMGLWALCCLGMMRTTGCCAA